MTGSGAPDWPEIERLCRETKLPLRSIAKTMDVPVSTLRGRVGKYGWRSIAQVDTQGAPRAADATVVARQTLVRRFYKAIDTKLKQMELRMKKDMESGEPSASSAADHERDARTIGGLINQLGKITEFETDLDRPNERGDATATAALAQEADRYRRDLAQRLARLLPPVD